MKKDNVEKRCTKRLIKFGRINKRRQNEYNNINSDANNFRTGFVQNISFSIVSRSRNRNNLKYHLIAALFSNTIWFLTFRQLIRGDMNYILFMPYCLGTMCGSLCDVKISMYIEKLLGAEADGHLKKSSEPTTNDLVKYWEYVEDKCPAWEVPLKFRVWVKEKSTLCPACGANPIAPNRETCVDCSH